MQTMALLLVFSIGIALGGKNIFWALVFGAVGALVAGAFFIARKKREGVLVLLGLTLFFIGVCRANLAELRFKDVSFPESPVTVVVESIDERETNTLVYGKISRTGTGILVRSFEKVPVLPGDTIAVAGAIQLPESFTTDTGRIFNYPAYLKSRGVSFIQNAKTMELIESGSWSVVRFFTILNQKIGDLLGRTVPFPIDSITAGMVLGDRSTIPKPIIDIFQHTGTLHLLVLSGYNITLLITFLGLAIRRWPFYVRVSLLALSIVSLVLLSGAGIAAVRAGLMALIVLVGQVAGRQYQALRALGVVFVGLLLWNPFLLRYDPGFQLSFLATLCMVVVVPKATPLFSFMPKKFCGLPLREAAAISTTAALFMLPFIAYFSGEISPLTILANFIASFFAPLITIGGMALVVVGALVLPLGVLMGAFLGMFGKILLFLLTLAAHVPTISIPPFSWWWVALAYLAIFTTLFWREIKSRA